MTFTNYEGQAKQACRVLATRNTGEVYKRALFMPGAQHRCLSEALKSGIVAPGKTELVLFERKESTAAKLQQQLKTNLRWVNGFEYSLYERDLTRTNLSGIGEPAVYDYAFFDFCGLCNPKVTRWLADTSAQWLRPGSRLSFSFCSIAVMPNNVQWLNTVNAMLRPYDHVDRQADFLNAADQTWEQFKEADDKLIPLRIAVMSQFTLLWSALPFRFKLQDCRVYRDNVIPMLFFHGHLTDEPVPVASRYLLTELLNTWSESHKPHQIRPAMPSSRELRELMAKLNSAWSSKSESIKSRHRFGTILQDYLKLIPKDDVRKACTKYLRRKVAKSLGLSLRDVIVAHKFASRFEKVRDFVRVYPHIETWEDVKDQLYPPKPLDPVLCDAELSRMLNLLVTARRSVVRMPPGSISKTRWKELRNMCSELKNQLDTAFLQPAAETAHAVSDPA